MIIETTINIHKTIMEQLNEAAYSTGQSRNYLIVLLLKRAMEENRRMIRFNRPVKYQQRDHLRKWHRLHVQFQKDVYEFCLDMRKFYKMSVSYIVAYAVIRFMNEIIRMVNEENIGNKTDNYHFSSYIFLQEVVDGAIHWRLYWGIPTNYNKIL